MTREETAIIIGNIPIDKGDDCYSIAEYQEAKTMAIKALEQEPCEDCISRQIISDYVRSHIQEINTGYGDLNKHTNRILRMIVDYIENMPPVIPQPKTGRWIEDENEMKVWCSECGDDNDNCSKFCPNCGVKMQEVTE